MARRLGYVLDRLCLMPYGAMLYGTGRMRGADSVRIALAGPLVNMVIGICCIALWWICPFLYPYTQKLFDINLSLCLVNLLPVYPLDGGKIALCCFKDKRVGARFLRWAGIILGIAMFIASLVSIFYSFNLSLGIMGVLLFCGAFSVSDKLQYRSLATLALAEKKLSKGILYRRVFVDCDVTLLSLLRWIDDEHLTDFVLYSTSTATSTQQFIDERVLDEQRVRELLLSHPLNTPLRDISP